MNLNTNLLPKSAQLVQKALDKSELACKVIQLTEDVKTAAAAANALGCEVAYF